MRIKTAVSKEEIDICFLVMKQLRPHLSSDAFVAKVEKQMTAHSYSLVYCEEDGAVKAVAGYRIFECLAWGKALYVDDLVTDEVSRGKGYGSELMDWILEKAKVSGCDQFHLDSGVQRFEAHRFYLHKKMDITGHHFALKLKA